jgi:hypothetical protein
LGRVNQGHVPVQVEVPRVAQCDSVEGVGVVNDELELLNGVDLDVSGNELPQLLELVGELRSAQVDVPYLREIQLVVCCLHGDDDDVRLEEGRPLDVEVEEPVDGEARDHPPDVLHVVAQIYLPGFAHSHLLLDLHVEQKQGRFVRNVEYVMRI